MFRTLSAFLRRSRAARPGSPRPAARFRPTLDNLEDRSLMAVTIGLQPVLSGLANPLLATNAGDGTNRLFVVEQRGVIRVMQPGASTSTVFLNLSNVTVDGVAGQNRVRSPATTPGNADNEQGLLGLAFHPNYETNGRFFVHYTTNAAGNGTNGVNVVQEYRASPTNPNVADPTPVRLILQFPPQPNGNHNGGSIEFGPDGLLYIAKGDGGAGNDPGNRAQNVGDDSNSTTANPTGAGDVSPGWFGKIHRIDVGVGSAALVDQFPADPLRNYSIPADNPFVGLPGRDEIFAFGLRNPYRISFDRGTGLLYAGDVGQGAREEIDIVVKGGNYGWRPFEGFIPTPGINPAEGAALQNIAVDPITDVGRALAASITGGYVYRGTQGSLPVGSYLFGDFIRGNVFLFQNGVTTTLLSGQGNISSFGEGENGELFVVRFNGTVTRVVSTSGNLPPVVVAIANRTIPATQDTVTVTVSATDPNGTVPVLSATAQSEALILDRRFGLRFSPDGLFENFFGGGERWVLGRRGPDDWFFILPNGQLWQWDGMLSLTGTQVGTPGATYHARPDLLTNAELAFDLDLSYGLRVDDGGLFENFFGAGERWLVNRGGTFYFILPDGRFFLWDGSNAASGTLIATLGSNHHDLIRLLHEGDQGQALASLSFAGNQLTVNRDDGFVASVVVTATAADPDLTGSRTFTVTVTA
ncbi:MAG: hypothetical protein C0501_04435 [Isosphaera sp.]|nr:hypothetical protein [Isosphaera sp.]